MNITNQQRQQAEERANEIQLRLYGEPEAGEQLWNIATRFGLTERSVYYTFSQLVGDVILGFYKVSDILQLIQYYLPTLDPMRQLELELEIKKFLLPLSTINQSATIATNTIPTIQPTVTMTQQQTEPPIYQSSQDTLLKPIEPSIPSNAPRWETE